MSEQQSSNGESEYTSESDYEGSASTITPVNEPPLNANQRIVVVDELQPLARFDVLYLGTANASSDAHAIDSIQEPLSKRYPINGNQIIQGIEAWLSVDRSGLQIQFCDDPSHMIYYPIRSLVYCASVRFTKRNADGQRLPNGWRFVRLDSPEANHITNVHNPPLFAIIFQRTRCFTVDECHCFVVPTAAAATALVEACCTAYRNTDSEQDCSKVPLYFKINEDASKIDEVDSDAFALLPSNIRKSAVNDLDPVECTSFFYTTGQTSVRLWEIGSSPMPDPNRPSSRQSTTSTSSYRSLTQDRRESTDSNRSTNQKVVYVPPQPIIKREKETRKDIAQSQPSQINIIAIPPKPPKLDATATKPQPSKFDVPTVRPKSPRAEAPVVQPEAPKINLPEVIPEPPRVEIPAIQPEVLKISAPEVRPESPIAEVPAIQPEVPKINIPEVKPKSAKANVNEVRPESPRAETPVVQPEAPKINVPEISPEPPRIEVLAIQPEVPKINIPEVKPKSSKANVNEVRPESPRAEAPVVQPEAPKINVPEISPEPPRTEVLAIQPEVPKINIPEVKPKSSKANVPEVRSESPKAKALEVQPELPKINVPEVMPEPPRAEIPAIQPEVLKISALEVKPKSFRVEAPATQLEVPKVNIPEVRPKSSKLDVSKVKSESPMTNTVEVKPQRSKITFEQYDTNGTEVNQKTSNDISTQNKRHSSKTNTKEVKPRAAKVDTNKVIPPPPQANVDETKFKKMTDKHKQVTTAANKTVESSETQKQATSIPQTKKGLHLDFTLYDRLERALSNELKLPVANNKTQTQRASSHHRKRSRSKRKEISRRPDIIQDVFQDHQGGVRPAANNTQHTHRRNDTHLILPPSVAQPQINQVSYGVTVPYARSFTVTALPFYPQSSFSNNTNAPFWFYAS